MQAMITFQKLTQLPVGLHNHFKMARTFIYVFNITSCIITFGCRLR